MLAHLVDGEHVDFHNLAVESFIGIYKGSERVDAGIVDQNIWTGGVQLSPQCVNLVFTRHIHKVRSHAYRKGREFVSGSGQSDGVNVNQFKVGAGFSKAISDSSIQTRSSARDKGMFAFE